MTSWVSSASKASDSEVPEPGARPGSLRKATPELATPSPQPQCTPGIRLSNSATPLLGSADVTAFASVATAAATSGQCGDSSRTAVITSTPVATVRNSDSTTAAAQDSPVCC